MEREVKPQLNIDIGAFVIFNVILIFWAIFLALFILICSQLVPKRILVFQYLLINSFIRLFLDLNRFRLIKPKLQLILRVLNQRCGKILLSLYIRAQKSQHCVFFTAVACSLHPLAVYHRVTEL